MYITVHQVQLPERGHRAAAPVQQTQYSSVHQYISTARALDSTGDGPPVPKQRTAVGERGVS